MSEIPKTNPFIVESSQNRAPLALSEVSRLGNIFIKYNILDGDRKVGDFDLSYPKKIGRVILDRVELDEDHQGKGYGKNLYKTVQSLPLPDGRTFAESGDTFGSSDMISPDAVKVWKGLVSDGSAVMLEDGSFEMLPLPQPTQPSPEQKIAA